MADTNISERHRRTFEALTSGAQQNFALFSCFLDGEPVAAIVAVNTSPPNEDDGEPEFLISPLFVSVEPGMKLTDHDGCRA